MDDLVPRKAKDPSSASSDDSAGPDSSAKSDAPTISKSNADKIAEAARTPGFVGSIGINCGDSQEQIDMKIARALGIDITK